MKPAKLMTLLFSASALAMAFADVRAEDNLIPVACKFEHLPLMLFIFRGGMGADDNTVQIGQNDPVTLNVGSSLMIAKFQNQEFIFSLDMPANVSIHGRGSNTLTYHGECISSPPI